LVSKQTKHIYKQNELMHDSNHPYINNRDYANPVSYWRNWQFTNNIRVCSHDKTTFAGHAKNYGGV
jgi:hypothetical protein